MAEANTAYMAAVSRHNQQTANVIIKNATDVFENIASIGSAFGEKGFKVSKGAAIAVATIKMYEAAVSAYASAAQVPYIGAYLAPVAAGAALAAGAANIASIKAQNYSGAYEHGGMIPAGGIGLVGEAGPEFVRGPAMVTSAQTTRDSGRLSSKPNITVHFHNATGVSATGQVQQTETDDGGIQIDLFMKKTEEFIASRVAKGGSPVGKSMETAYGLNRGKKAR
jgi:hypothetical protein